MLACLKLDLRVVQPEPVGDLGSREGLSGRDALVGDELLQQFPDRLVVKRHVLDFTPSASDKVPRPGYRHLSARGQPAPRRVTPVDAACQARALEGRIRTGRARRRYEPAPSA